VAKAVCFCVLVLGMLQVSEAQSSDGKTKSGVDVQGSTSAAVRLPLQPASDQTNQLVPIQQFVCSSGYTETQCHEQMMVLRKALAVYPVRELGRWSWILVRSQEWKSILMPRGLAVDSPAFTFYPKRETFIEEALVTQVPVRERELLLKWSMSRERLLDFAIRHELGHAFCNDPSEQHADRIAKLLEQKQAVTCETAGRSDRR
jgi:hypothetical protein